MGENREDEDWRWENGERGVRLMDGGGKGGEGIRAVGCRAVERVYTYRITSSLLCLPYCNMRYPYSVQRIAYRCLPCLQQKSLFPLSLYLSIDQFNSLILSKFLPSAQVSQSFVSHLCHLYSFQEYNSGVVGKQYSTEQSSYNIHYRAA